MVDVALLSRVVLNVVAGELISGGVIDELGPLIPETKEVARGFGLVRLGEEGAGLRVRDQGRTAHPTPRSDIGELEDGGGEVHVSDETLGVL